MEIKKIKEGENSVLIEAEGEDYTLLVPISEELWENSNVSESAVIRDHPYLSKPQLWVKTSKGKPTEAIVKAAEKMEKLTKSIEEKISSKLK